jgi:hypothetical protein
MHFIDPCLRDSILSHEPRFVKSLGRTNREARSLQEPGHRDSTESGDVDEEYSEVSLYTSYALQFFNDHGTGVASAFGFPRREVSLAAGPLGAKIQSLVGEKAQGLAHFPEREPCGGPYQYKFREHPRLSERSITTRAYI